MSREAIFKALFALTEGVEWNVGTEDAPVMQGFGASRTRRIALFTDVPVPAQPWLGQAEHRETFGQVTNRPYRNVYGASWIVYHSAGKNKKFEPTIVNNLILDALEKAIAPKPVDPGFLDRRNTLSGLVHHCYLDGEVLKDPGDIDDQAMLVIPIRILVP